MKGRAGNRLQWILISRNDMGGGGTGRVEFKCLCGEGEKGVFLIYQVYYYYNCKESLFF